MANHSLRRPVERRSLFLYGRSSLRRNLLRSRLLLVLLQRRFHLGLLLFVVANFNGALLLLDRLCDFARVEQRTRMSIQGICVPAFAHIHSGLCQLRGELQVCDV